MLDLIVVGGGFWGVSIAFRAQLQGMTVLLLDDNQPLAGSRNSSGIAHLSSYKADWIKNRWPEEWSHEEVEESFSWLAEHFSLERVDEHFVNLFQNRPSRFRGDAYTIKDNQSFLSRFPHKKAKAHHIERTGSEWVVLTERREVFTSRSVVLAAGIWTNEILTQSNLDPIELSSVEGWGMKFKPSPEVGQSPLLTTYMTKPYIKYTARPWSRGFVRLGDTTERQGKKPRYPQLTDLAEEISPGHSDEEWVGGYRPTTPKFLVDSPLPGLVIATGGYRAGLGIAGLAARRTLEMLS